MQVGPQILKTTRQNNTLVIECMVYASLPDFKGHFPYFPILPGASQIDWIWKMASALVGKAKFIGLDVLKFNRPIFPNDIIIISLDFNKERQKLVFKISDKERNLYSSGRFSLELENE